MLADGSHVKIGSYSLLLDETVDAGTQVGNLYRPHYKYSQSTLGIPRQTVAGAQKDNLRPNRMVWYMGDWSGGEGQRNFDAQDSTQYGSAVQVNPRIPSQLQGPPGRIYDSTSLATQQMGHEAYLDVAANTVWCGGSYHIFYVSNFTTTPWTWTQVNSTNVPATDYTGLESLSTNYKITSTAGDQTYFYYGAWNPVAGKRVIMAKVKDQATTLATQLSAEETITGIWQGLARMGPRLYAWSGYKLYGFDVTSGVTGLTGVLKDTRGTDSVAGPGLGVGQYADVVTAESSVFYFYSTEGLGEVYEYSEKRGPAPVWKAPQGLSIRGIAYNNGVVYLTCHWGGETNATGRAELWAIPLDTRRAVHVHTWRNYERVLWGTSQTASGPNANTKRISRSYGDQVLFSVSDTTNSTEAVAIYDAKYDGVTTLDEYSSTAADTDALGWISRKKVSDTLTFGNRRLVAFYDYATGGGPGVYKLLAYKTDAPADVQTSSASGNFDSGYLQSPSWDFDIPFEQKVLMGYDVTFKPLTAGQSLSILSYLDDATTPAVTKTITFSGADSQLGRTFFSVSDTTTTYKFTKLRVVIKLTGTRTGGVDYAPPVVYDVAAEAATLQYENTWELIVRLKNPSARTRGSKTGAMQNGDAVRDFIRTTVADRKVVTFVDGYRYKGPGKSSTHSVTIEDPEDIIIQAGEGSMRMVLREIPR